ncbi:hypothetical protein B0H17DRAFT_1138399 [Mycena rosella]|uniref:Uncharacterized protein n=1 Tax=Mycena rosella TaxID=1033263 RepID=A0AAD7D6E8_MYCRO|nr:hypothetical protein B0H17DRAFT_1138399 [Mycena rosella]
MFRILKGFTVHMRRDLLPRHLSFSATPTEESKLMILFRDVDRTRFPARFNILAVFGLRQSTRHSRGVRAIFVTASLRLALRKFLVTSTGFSRTWLLTPDTAKARHLDNHMTAANKPRLDSATHRRTRPQLVHPPIFTSLVNTGLSPQLSPTQISLLNALGGVTGEYDCQVQHQKRRTNTSSSYNLDSSSTSQRGRERDSNRWGVVVVMNKLLFPCRDPDIHRNDEVSRFTIKLTNFPVPKRSDEVTKTRNSQKLVSVVTESLLERDIRLIDEQGVGWRPRLKLRKGR